MEKLLITDPHINFIIFYILSLKKKKLRKKILLCTALFISFVIIVGVCRFISEEKRFSTYSTYCMNQVRAELGEELGNIVSLGNTETKGGYHYYGNVTYEGIKYAYSCTVLDKDHIDLKLEPEINPSSQEDINLNLPEENNSLIIYFSPTGNTKRIATFISEITHTDIEEIIPNIPYTTEDLNRRDNESRSFKEHEDPSIRPDIQTKFRLDEYDTIYLGYPIWFGVTPNIILTLLETYDFSGKTVVLFCTSEHVGIEKSVEYLNPYDLNIIGSKRFSAESTKNDVLEWLESL